MIVGTFSSVFFILGGLEFRIKMLPQPWEQLLKTLLMVNILEVKNILEFLAIFPKIQHLSDSQVFEIIYLFCI